MPVGRWVAVAGERIRVAVGAAIASVAVAEVDRNTVAVAGESGEAGTPLGEAICVTQATSHSAHAPWPIIRTNNRRILSICCHPGNVHRMWRSTYGAVHPLGRVRSEAERKGQVGCSTGSGGLYYYHGHNGLGFRKYMRAAFKVQSY
jgi:hypothetical protein